MHGFLSDALSAIGCRARVTSAQRIAQLESDFEHAGAGGPVSERLRLWLRRNLKFRPPAGVVARSVLVVAVPSPKVRVVFHHNGRTVPALIPPAYADKYSVPARIMQSLEGVLSRRGSRAAEAKLPLKLLAARTGLGFYGKNNLCYAPGMGSLLRLAAFWLEVSCDEDDWQDAALLARCADCHACSRACPTGSISRQRMVIDADRCLSHFNGERGSFPAWIDPSWHNCLVGCLYCQEACPENAELLEKVQDMGEFSEDETEGLLAGAPLSRLPPRTRSHLDQICMVRYYDCLARNLGALLHRASDSKEQLP